MTLDTSAKEASIAADPAHARPAPAGTPRPRWLDSGRIPSLDGLRAVAVILVLLAHACQTQGFPGGKTVIEILRNGGIGVVVFFVISGFLITTLMLREIDRTEKLSIKGFYIRRILRIVPAYVTYLLAIAFLQVAGITHPTRADWIASATYTVNFLPSPAWVIGHVWSLSIEEHFYLLWPLIIALAGPRRATSAAIILIAISFISRFAILFQFRQYTAMADSWTFTRIDSIAFGCLLALVARDDGWRARLDRWCARRVLVAFVGLLLLACIGLAWRSGKFHVAIALGAWPALIALLLWAAIGSPTSAIGRLLNNPVMVAIGVWSYSLYLWQQLFLDHHRTGFVWRFPQNIVFALGAAFLSYRLIEKPFLSLKDRLSEPAKRGGVKTLDLSSPVLPQMPAGSPESAPLS